MNNILTDISYKGKVSIKLSHNGNSKPLGEIHNEGTLELFKILSAALIGSNISNEVPSYIDAYIGNSSTSTPDFNNPALISKAIITRRILTTDEGVSYATFTALIPRSYISQTSGYIVGLSINNRVNRLANLTLSEDTVEKSQAINIESEFPSNSSLIVEWKMAISNA